MIGYHIKDLGIETLIGKKIISAEINDDNDLVVLDTDKGKLYLTWEGSCCAHCYLAQISGTENLIDAEILEAQNAEWKDLSRNEDEYEVLESMGTNIKTSKGYVTLESRVSHNGYYGGEILVSVIGPINQYDDLRYETATDFPKTHPLKDF